MSAVGPSRGRQGLEKACLMLQLLDGETAADAAYITLLALAMQSMFSRNKEHTLLEHFDGISASYQRIFRLLQSTGIEQNYEAFRQKRNPLT